jgi:GGDEF domain-containing protein
MGMTQGLDHSQDVPWWLATARLLSGGRGAHSRSHDAATGLPGPAKFHEQGNRLLADCRAKGRPVSLVLFDASQLALEAQAHGRAAMRRLRQALADKLAAVASGPGLAARTGEYEFALLLPRVGEPQALQMIALELGAPAEVVAADDAADDLPGLCMRPLYLACTVAPDGRTLQAWCRALRHDLRALAGWCEREAAAPQTQDSDAREGPGSEDQDTRIDLRDWQVPFDAMPATVTAGLSAR